MNSRFAFIIFVIATLLLVLSCGPAVDSTVGAACEDDRDCDEECITGWPGGFCTISCQDHADCPPDTLCTDTESGVCLFACDHHDDCKALLGEEFKCEDETDFESREVWVCTD